MTCTAVLVLAGCASTPVRVEPDVRIVVSSPKAGEVAKLTCHALRGEGYDLVEMHQYDAAHVAYRACLKQIPGEPRSLAELKYIDQIQMKEKGL